MSEAFDPIEAVSAILGNGQDVRRADLLRARRIARKYDLPEEVMGWLYEGLYQLVAPLDYTGDITTRMLTGRPRAK